MPFSQTTLNAFEMTRREAACEIPAKHAGHRAFIHIYPPRERKRLQWIVKRFEVPAELVQENLYDVDFRDLELLRLDSLEQVEDVLRSWGIASSMFDAPWKCDSPA